MISSKRRGLAELTSMGGQVEIVWHRSESRDHGRMIDSL
jgi:hypothetical protein